MRTINRFNGEYVAANIRESSSYEPMGAGNWPAQRSGGAGRANGHEASFIMQLLALLPWKFKLICFVVVVSASFCALADLIEACDDSMRQVGLISEQRLFQNRGDFE